MKSKTSALNTTSAENYCISQFNSLSISSNKRLKQNKLSVIIKTNMKCNNINYIKT